MGQADGLSRQSWGQPVNQGPPEEGGDVMDGVLTFSHSCTDLYIITLI